MEISEIGASTSNTLGEAYNVFLSFRGPDSCRGFTGTLHQALIDAGIHVFVDDEELRLGERISNHLLQAIDNCMLYIPIFSTNYASSHWCLRELAKMVENTSKSKEHGNKKVILPIFYDVNPDDVMLKTELYRNAISKLEQSIEEVEKWRHALSKVGGTRGWELEKYLSEGKLIESVVDEAVFRLQTRQRRVIRHLVGMEDPVVAIKNLLDIQSSDVRLIGIYGMGGTGKTTLAMIVFNQLCHHFGSNCSFLQDVREVTKSIDLVCLQQQLLSDMSDLRVASKIQNIDQGINWIRDRICNKKALIVLDDVNEDSQIQNLVGVNSLYPGTRILVTTRDKRVLKIKGFKHEIVPYEMEWLSHQDALRLFSRFVFNDDSPLASYHTISEHIVSTTGGLPLALKAIGSMLFNAKGTEIWLECLERLRETIQEDVMGKLRSTYDTLEKDQQHIFLDIACFFIGQNKIGPFSLWKDCGFRVEHAIDVLIDMSMIKILDDNSFWMHEQLKYLGRTIAKAKHTRLWYRGNITRELRSTKNKGSVQALHLQAEVDNPIVVTAEQIKQFPHLQFLWLSNVICRGDLTGCLSELKWISFHYSHTPKHYQGFKATNLPVENLVVVELSGAEFTVDKWKSLIRGARKLQVCTVYCDAPPKIMSRI